MGRIVRMCVCRRTLSIGLHAASVECSFVRSFVRSFIHSLYRAGFVVQQRSLSEVVMLLEPQDLLLLPTRGRAAGATRLGGVAWHEQTAHAYVGLVRLGALYVSVECVWCQ